MQTFTDFNEWKAAAAARWLHIKHLDNETIEDPYDQYVAFDNGHYFGYFSDDNGTDCGKRGALFCNPSPTIDYIFLRENERDTIPQI